MVQKRSSAITLLVLILGFSIVLSSLAVPTTRSLKSSSEENPSSSVQDLLTQDAIDLKGDGQELVDIINGRMDLERQDYPGTGANNHHDPKTPGRA